MKKLSESLVKKFGTRDPFQIAGALGYTVIHVPLIGIRGFYQQVQRCKIIYLDDALSENEARFVCAHELGHALLHNGYNRIFMDTQTHMITSRYERDANRFAVDLLIEDDDLKALEGYPVQTIAACLGISEDLARYRIQGK
ncbi:MAG: ImmA/IrrE family metallo-endopeptidase [Oscillospiraceae bacterium]|jgi:Zn-dependent peptidase ImmA (M78 family)